MNPEWRNVLVPVFLLAQALVIYAGPGGEHPPPPPVIASFPATFGQWNLFHQDPIDAAMATGLGADSLTSQTYIETPTNSFASVLVAWYQSQREGVRQPHSPKVCLPSAGWKPRVVDEVTIATAAGAIVVNRYVIDKSEQRAVVLYWYQTPRRVIAGEWAAKIWLVADAWRYQRTDTALVRVVAWPASGGDEAATAVATGFASNLYPLLRKYLPH